MLHAVRIDVHLAQSRGIGCAIPDEVAAAMAGAQVVVEAGDRVGDDLLSRRQIEDEVGEDVLQCPRRQIGLARRAAPDVVTGIDRLQFRCQLGADGGAHAVTADHDIGVLDAAAAEVNANAAAVLLHSLERPAEMIMRGIDGRAQQPLQTIPRGQDLAQWPLRGDAALPVDGEPFLYFDAEVVCSGAAALQRLQQFRVGRNAGAAADELDRRALVDVDVPADPPQERRAEQPRHRTADDDRPAFFVLSSRHGALQRKNPSNTGRLTSAASAMMA